MNTATIRLLDLLRASHGDCTDYRVAKLLGIGNTAVSKWRTGKGHMSPDNILKACRLAGIESQAFVWNTRIAAERETGEAQRQALDMLADLERMERGEPPREGGIVDMLINWGRHVAAIVAALAITLGLAFAPVKPASAAPLLQGGEVAGLYLMRSGRRWFRRWLQFGIRHFRIAGLTVAAAALPGCAGVTSFEAAAGFDSSQWMPWTRGPDGFEGPRDLVRFTVRQDMGRAFCSVTHVSHLSAGWPFNDAREDWLDLVECGARFTLHDGRP